MSKRTIAIIDDDAICRLVVKKQVASSEQPTDTMEFNNGREALDHFLANERNADAIPDVILLDIFMPVMNGWEFLDAISSVFESLQKTPIIYVMSSTLDDGDIERAESNPLVNGFLAKPLKLRQIQRIVYQARSYNLAG